MKKFILPILILGLMMVAMPSYAAIYVDSDNGDDSNAAEGCTETAPCATFSGSKHLLGDDSTMYLSGDFSEKIDLYLNDSGTAEAPLLISAWSGRNANFTYAGDVVTLLGTEYITFEGLNITNSGTSDKSGIVLSNGADNVTINNCTIHDVGKRGINVKENLENTTISNNTIYDTEGHGIKIGDGGSNITISNNTVYNTGTDNSSSAIETQADATITQNKIYDNYGGINIGGAGQITDALVSNNYIYNNETKSINANNKVDNLEIINNTIYGKDENQTGFYVSSDYQGTTINLTNNLFYLSGTTGFIYEIKADGFTLDSNFNLFYYPNLTSSPFKGTDADRSFDEWQAQTYDVDSLNKDPLLTDIDNKDFTLTENSPAVDAGKTIEDITEDYEGDTRPMGDGHDIGADEYFILNTPANTTNTSKGVYIATLGWDEVNGAESYNIRYRKATSSDYTNATSATNSLDLTGLMNAGKYYWQVQAVAGDYTSEWSDEKRLVTNPRKIKKGEVKVIEKTSTAARIRIDSMKKRVTGFNIIVAKKTNGTYKKVETVKVSNKSTKKYTRKWIEDLKPDTKYRIRIKARRKIGSTKFLSQNTVSQYFTTLSE